MKLIIFLTMLLISAGGSSSAAQVSDLTITNISRVSGKHELRVTVANSGKAEAKKVKLRVYALPYGYCVKQSPYSPSDENGGYPCFDKPLEIPIGHRFTSVDSIKNRLGLSWIDVALSAFDLAAGGKIEKIVNINPVPLIVAGDKPKKVFPVPYLQESSSYLFAPWSILKFDLSVFYATVEAEGEVNKNNNDYFFNIRQRGRP